MGNQRRIAGIRASFWVTALALLGLSLSAWIVSCSVSVGLGPGAGEIGFGILGKTFTMSFGDVGAIEFVANVSLPIPTGLTLFAETPTQAAPNGRMLLPSASVGIAQRLTGKTANRSKPLPLNGSAAVTFSIASGHSTSLCDGAALLSQYDIALTSGAVAVLDEEYELSPQALAIIATNEVTICVNVDADFDGQLTLGEFSMAFGGGDESAVDGDADTDAGTGDDPANAGPNGFFFIPIDNRDGQAVATSVNRIIGGVSYGIVGVLEAKTPAVTTPTANPDTVSINPAALGLAAVTRLHLAVHSSFVPDVFDGVRAATLTAEYTQGGDPATLHFDLGANTAEWSYTRVEHQTAYGGVQHAQAPVLYSFTSTADSAAEYTGYVYSASLPLDALRTLSRLTLSMNSPEAFSSARLASGDLATWAAQAITAVTLEGVPLPPPEPTEPEACCTALGTCRDDEPGTCQLAEGTALGPGTTCAADSGRCSEIEPEGEPPQPEPEDPTGACCFVDADCEDRTLESCEFVLADYEGDGTTCATFTCPAQIEYVVWHTGNVCCWGAPLMYISDRITFNQPRLRSSFSGGGINPTDLATKVELQGGFDSIEDARAWICPQFTSSSFHYWCGRHYQRNGNNWRPGGLGCDFTSLPDNPDPPRLPDADVCRDVADSMLNTVACCYPDTSCAEVELPDCTAGGGKPHPGGHALCGVEICPGGPPPCPQDEVCDLACPSFDDDPDCKSCGANGRCILGCAVTDPDCCPGSDVVKNGGGENGSAAQDFETVVRLDIDGWNVFQGRLTPVAYAIGGPTHPNAAVSAGINGGNNYFAGGPAGISPTIAQQSIFLNEHLPLSLIRTGRIRATLSAHIGGFITQADDAFVRVVFRDELLNDLSSIKIGPVSNVERGNVTGLLSRCASALIPPDAMTAEIRITARRFIGLYNDGFVDNVALYLAPEECSDDESGCGN